MSILELIKNERACVLSTMSSIFHYHKIQTTKVKRKQGKRTKNEKMNNLEP
jgi:ribosomal protein L17